MAETPANPRIFVSYRRSEAGTAGRIFDRLVDHFGADSVFIDIDNIPYGVDFRQHIGEALRPGDLLLAIVGRNWLGPLPDGERRIDDETDPVRVEIETALERDIKLLPVLVDDAKMPSAAELPASIGAFAYRNAAEVESGRDFHFHVDRLIRSIDGIVGGKLTPVAAAAATSTSKPESFRRFLLPLGLGLAGLAVVALGITMFSVGGRVSVESDQSSYAVEVSRSSSAPPTFDAALSAWSAVKDSESVAALELFIAKFGDSFYADMARAKREDLIRKDRERQLVTARKAPESPKAIADDPTPANMIRDVYEKLEQDRLFGPNNPADIANRKVAQSFFSPEFIQLLERNARCWETGEGVQIWVDGSDYTVTDVDVSAPSRTAETQTVVAQFKNFDQEQIWTFKFRRFGDGWRVEDIMRFGESLGDAMRKCIG